MSNHLDGISHLDGRRAGHCTTPTGARGARGAPSDIELAVRQLQAIQTWHRARHLAEQVAATRAQSRETRMDLGRRLEVLREQHAAIVERTHESLLSSVRLLHCTAPRRAVVGHRNVWFADKLCGDLTRRGVQVIGRFESGAAVVGASVAEQPDLVVVEDRLAMLSGEDVVREVRRYVPDAVIAAQVAYDDRVALMLAAGATVAYPRRVPPLEVSADLERLFTADLQTA